MGRVWEEANKLLSAEKPELDKEIRRIEDQIAKTQARLDRYFDAFETGAMKPELCHEKVEDLTARLGELEAEKRELEARRARLEITYSLFRTFKIDLGRWVALELASIGNSYNSVLAQAKGATHE